MKEVKETKEIRGTKEAKAYNPKIAEYKKKTVNELVELIKKYPGRACQYGEPSCTTSTKAQVKAQGYSKDNDD